MQVTECKYHVLVLGNDLLCDKSVNCAPCPVFSGMHRCIFNGYVNPYIFDLYRSSIPVYSSNLSITYLLPISNHLRLLLT